MVGLVAVAGACVAPHVIVLPPQGGRVVSWIFWAMTGVFALRVVGDFRYVGFFRKVRTSDFAVMDARLYTLLCAGDALAFGWMAAAG